MSNTMRIMIKSRVLATGVFLPLQDEPPLIGCFGSWMVCLQERESCLVVLKTGYIHSRVNIHLHWKALEFEVLSFFGCVSTYFISL